MLAKPEVPIPPSVEAIIRTILDIRKFLKEAEKQYKAHIALAVQKEKHLLLTLREFLDATKMKSVRTDAGTVYINVLPSASCSDPDAFMNYVKESGEFELLNRSPNKTACIEFTEKHGHKPPGVEISYQRSAKVRMSP